MCDHLCDVKMLSRLGILARRSVGSLSFRRHLSPRGYSSAVPVKPTYYHSLGIAKVLVVSTPFIYVGAFMAKSFAAYLEDLDLFVPDDDDD